MLLRHSMMRALNNKKTKLAPEKAASIDAAMDALARLVAARERSTHEVSTRLKDKGFDEDVVEQAVKRGCTCGLLDDERFARSYVKDKSNAGWGKRRIEQELYRYGLRLEVFAGYPEEFFCQDDELAHALKALERHHSRSKNPRQAAYRYLVGKGFSFEIASAAIKAHEARLADDC